jgi:hypothetical protein
MGHDNAGIRRRYFGALRCLIDLQRQYRRANQRGRYRRWIGGQRRNVKAEERIREPMPKDAPNGLTEKFVTLATMEFVEEIFEIPRRWLFKPL